MSLQIYVAHTGDRYLADPVSFTSPDALRSWVANSADIPAQRQILMTGRGKNVKIQTLLTENEIFVYDKQYITPPTSSSQPVFPPGHALPRPYAPADPPSSLSNPDNLQAWRDLFMARRRWALEVSETVSPMQDTIREYLAQTSIINRAVTVAVDNLKSHLGSIQNRFAETRVWAQDTLKDQKAALSDWEGSVETLKKIPAKEEFTYLLRHPSTPTKRSARAQDARGTLLGFIHPSQIKDAAAQASQASSAFAQKLAGIEDALRDVAIDTDTAVDDLRNRPEELLTDEDINNLFEESETFAKKINSDYEHILRLPDNSKSIANTSRMALSHTTNFLPSLKAVAQEIDQAVRNCIETRNAAVQSALQSMQNISVIESGLADIQSQIQKLDMDAEGIDAFDTLDLVFRLPSVYGSILVESLRRKEWDEKVRTDSASLAEEMALYKDEEQRRRRKWLKTMTPFIDEMQETPTTGMEVNLLGGPPTWPSVMRDDLDVYVENLRRNFVEEAYQEVSKMIRDLDSPTRQQKKRARAFKNGSLHDAGFGLGRSSLMLRGDDDSTRNLKDENSKLGDKLKASESRVRKLEDLLHRQGPLSRPLSGTFGVSPSDYERHLSSAVAPTSPRPDGGLSRRSSVSSRRLSSNQTAEDKGLARRIVNLEAELMQERDTVSRLQREAHVERRSSTESRDRMNEAESMKKDLMANLEAQRQEFEDERQLLEDESHKLKIRLEEAEDELDRVVDSRDQEKVVADTNIRDLRTQLDQMIKTNDYERQQSQLEISALNSDLAGDRNRMTALEKNLQDIRDERSSLQNRNIEMARQLHDAESTRAEHVLSLQAAHSQLSPEGSAPEDLGRLVEAIEVLSEGLAIHARGSDEVAQLVSAENKALEERLAKGEEDIESLEQIVASKETDEIRHQEVLAEERSKLASLRSELASEQSELKELRAKFAAGETGSEALKDRVAEEERRVTEISEKLAVAASNVQSFEQEIRIWKDKVQSLTETERQLKAHLDSRGARSKELSQRLYTQNDRMIRVMEHMGYSLTRQDDQLVIQRASKVNASITLPPASTNEMPPMNRSLSVPGPVQHYSDAADLDLLYWSDTNDATEDKKFQAFIASLTRLDLDAASELIAKRYRDVETLARKWQRESRGYREKYHRAQSEGHEKIAYRGFKEGDLALFLPTRNQATRPWAAFNVGAPHYFLREQDGHKLQTRDWLLARISKVEERIVDLSRSMTSGVQDRRSLQAETSDAGSVRSVDDENPFELSDGLRWYMIDAFEEKPGAPTTPGLGKSTVASTNVDARGSIQLTKEKKKNRDSIGAGNAATATKTLSRSLDSRRSSSGSKKGHVPGLSSSSGNGMPSALGATGSSHDGAVGDGMDRTDPSSSQPRVVEEGDGQSGVGAREDAPIFEEEATKRSNRIRASSPLDGLGLTHGSASGTSSPHKSRAISPEKPKARGWDRLWSMEYKSGGSSSQ